MANLLQQFEARIDRRLQEQTQMIESLKASSAASSRGTSSEPSSDFQDFDARDESETHSRTTDHDSSWDVSTIFLMIIFRIGAF